MDPNEEPPLQRSSSSTLSSEEFESWTLLDSSPKPRRPKMKPEEATKPGGQPEMEVDSDEEEDDAEESEEEESGSEEADEEEEEVQVDKCSKPSGVEPVKNKPKQTKSENVARDEDGDGRVVEQGSSKKKRTGSNASAQSHDGFSSDGISVISESDGSEHARLLHFNKHLNIDALQQSSVQLTPPLSPEAEDDRAGTERSKRHKQLKRKRSHDEAVEATALVPESAVVPWRHVNRTSFVVFSIVMTGIAAILVGNSRVYENRANVDSFNHEQRLSELELENTILRNEMNKLKHLYTRSELDEQVQQAEFEWMQAMDQEMQDQSPVEPEPQPEPEPPTTTTESEPEQPQVRRVPPQDDHIRHKVVWSGDDGQPMLIADKDYVLPEFCYNKNAVKDELFSEYSTKYCDTKQRKIEAKLKKAEYYASKHNNKHKHPRDYKQYIHPTAEEVAEHQKQAAVPPPKAPSLSPFEFDYLGAFETIKEEGTVILQSLTAILDLDPEPEPISNDGYLADDEASSSSSSSSNSPSTSQSTISVGSVQPESGQPAVNAISWNDYPPWVREKYENQPEMYRKLQNKAPLLWEWERKKNQFLDEVGLTTLEEVDGRTEDELRQRRQQYEKERGGEYASHKKFDKYEDRNKGKGKKYDERKEWKQDRPRNGDNRSYENKDYRQKDQHKEFKDKKDWRNGDKSREYQSKEHRDDPQAGTSAPSTSNGASHQKQYSGESRESSGDRYKDHRKHGEHSKERKDGERKDHHKKNGDQHKHRERDSDERSSGDGSYMKQYHKEDHKKQYKSKEEYHQDKKYDERKQHHDRHRDDDHDDDDDDDDDHYKRRHHDKHRNGDYRKHEQKEWHEKRHKHKDEYRNKHHHHEEKKWRDRDRDHHQSKERRR